MNNILDASSLKPTANFSEDAAYTASLYTSKEICVCIFFGFININGWAGGLYESILTALFQPPGPYYVQKWH